MSCTSRSALEGGMNFENSRGWKEKHWKIPGGGESFDGIPGECSLQMDILNRGGGTVYYWKSPLSNFLCDFIHYTFIYWENNHNIASEMSKKLIWHFCNGQTYLNKIKRHITPALSDKILVIYLKKFIFFCPKESKFWPKNLAYKFRQNFSHFCPTEFCPIRYFQSWHHVSTKFGGWFPFTLYCSATQQKRQNREM